MLFLKRFGSKDVCVKREEEETLIEKLAGDKYIYDEKDFFKKMFELFSHDAKSASIRFSEFLLLVL